ncbi:hypothetical protein QR680_012326 [Steinernema hermaphroditum]|uniref:Uncharacterized protein n=1 Tax=Steinernema hermaphroditum TaxID=289476 RepID=A0AA39I4F0_9BILA|nr:hypothetical protein QR680_012326 [Steinernema hermaphroditum]
MSAMVSKQKNRCKLSAQVLAYLTWKNFGGQPIEVAVLYPFIEGHFPRYANCRTTYDPIDFTRKSIRTSLTNYFEGTISETRENPQRWTVKSAYMQNLEEEAQKCLPGGVLHAQMVAIMARPDLLVRLVDGTWGAKGPDGAELHKTKKAQEAEKKSRKRCSPTEAVRKPRKKKRTVEGGAFVAAPSYYAQHSMHYQYGYPTQWNPHTLQMAQQRYGAPYPTQGYWHQPTMLPYPQPVVLPILKKFSEGLWMRCGRGLRSILSTERTPEQRAPTSTRM